jgi:hypothetical protein
VESQNVQFKRRILYRALIELFLRRNPGSPYKILFWAIDQFTREFGDFGIETLAFFYRYVAVSEKIVEYIFPGDALGSTTTRPLKKTPQSQLQIGTAPLELEPFKKNVSLPDLKTRKFCGAPISQELLLEKMESNSGDCITLSVSPDNVSDSQKRDQNKRILLYKKRKKEYVRCHTFRSRCRVRNEQIYWRS